ncbi:MAG: tilS [Verrucomicrobiales bacterium]|nr:tilS [Verrucomicrobiales bacterium]
MVQSFKDKILGAILAHRLLSKGSRILVGVSGGVDSMALLAIFCQLKSALQIELRVAHFNHQLRGSESDQDLVFVREHCQKLGIPFIEGAGDVAGLSKTSGVSMEMSARKLRREFLAETARAQGCTHIALAHHADDQVETFFLRLFRGAGLEGLSGMSWSGPDPFNPELMVIRPFLGVSKAEILAFARADNIVFRLDSSNSDSEMGRNFLRNKLLPLIRQEVNPAVNDAVLRAMAQIQDNQALIEWSLHDLEKGNLSVDFSTLPIAVQAEWIKRQLHELDLPCSFELITRLRTLPPIWIEVMEGVSVSLTPMGTIIKRGERSLEFNPSEASVSLVSAQKLEFGGYQISWELQAGENLPESEEATEYFDAGKVGESIILRHWRPGDKFRPIGNSHESKLQDIFVDLKIDVVARRQLLVGEAVNKGIFWVQGLRISDAFKLDKDSRQRLKWKWARL